MASNSESKIDEHAGGDQQERDVIVTDVLSSVEDQHFHFINEKGDMSNSIACDVTKELIARESKHNIAQSSEPATRSSYTLSTIMSTRNSCNHDSTLRSAESSDSESLIDEDSNSQNINHSVDSAVSELSRGQYDSTIDERLPETVTLLTTPDGGKLYLVGTAHFSVESQNDVSKIIQAVQPHIVVVELCRARAGILQLDEEAMFRYAKNIDYKTIMAIVKREGFYNGLLHILLLRMAAQVAQQLGMPPGGEFRRAFEEVKKVPNCIVHLADRPINITMKRAIRLLSWWQTIKLGWHLVIMKEPITQEDIELCKQRSTLDEIIAGMRKEFPVLGEVFVKERDIYLTNSLQLACTPHRTTNRTYEPTRAVGIVGLGHTPGIIENWGKVHPHDIPPIMRIPPPSLSSKILKLTIKASVFGAIIYVGYKIIAVPAATTFHTIKSSVEELLKVGATR